MKILSIFTISLILLQACTNSAEKEKEKTTVVSAPETGKHGKPSEKDVILMVMQNSDVLLSVDSSCSGVGTDFGDKTIGQYLSGFWQYHANRESRNALTITVDDGDHEEIKEKHWKATFMINGQTEGENWSWGVSFYVMDKDWQVVRNSFKCLGAG